MLDRTPEPVSGSGGHDRVRKDVDLVRLTLNVRS
jgi:hypothetical protein